MASKKAMRAVAEIPAHQKELLQRSTPSAADIFSNMSAFNEEITDAHSEYLDDSAQADELVTDASVAAEKLAAVASMRTLIDPLDEQHADQPVEPGYDPIAEQMAAMVAAAEAEKAQRAAEEPEEPEPEELDPEEAMRSKILKMLGDSKDAPSAKQIAAWKRQWRDDVNVIALGEGDVYVFVPLVRGQWQQIQETASKVSGTAQAPTPEKVQEFIQETVIKYAIKWPKHVHNPEFTKVSKAGVIPTLYEVIMLHSFFLNPAQAMMLTTKL